jgi:hypothetical protein
MAANATERLWEMGDIVNVLEAWERQVKECRTRGAQMTLHQWLGMSATMLLLGLVIFAFRQGLKVKPDDRENRRPSVGGTGSDHNSGDGGY